MSETEAPRLFIKAPGAVEKKKAPLLIFPLNVNEAKFYFLEPKWEID